MQKQCFSSLPLDVKGHVRIADDLGNILVDSDNAVHPQNMARVIARALANESNYYVYRIAFGNGGTTVDAAYTITYNPPHDGQSPDTKTWDSRLYKETYSEIVDDNDHLAEMGVDPGSAGDEEGQRPGGGSVPADDPPTVPNVSGPGVFSNELGLTSEVVVYCVLNPNEPKSEYLTDTLAPTESTDTSFTFDEIGLYTLGAAGIDTGGYQNIDVGTKLSTDVITGFAAGNAYSFDVAVDGAAPVTVGFTVISPLSGSGGASEILLIRTQWAVLTVSTLQHRFLQALNLRSRIIRLEAFHQLQVRSHMAIYASFVLVQQEQQHLLTLQMQQRSSLT